MFLLFISVVFSVSSVWGCELPSYTRGSTGRGSIGRFINWWPLVCNWNTIALPVEGSWLSEFTFRHEDWEPSVPAKERVTIVLNRHLRRWLTSLRSGSVFDLLWTFIYLSMTPDLTLSPCFCVTCYWQNSISQPVAASDATKQLQPPLYSLCLFLPPSINTYITCRSRLVSRPFSPPLCLWSSSIGLSLAEALPAWVCQVLGAQNTFLSV